MDKYWTLYDRDGRQLAAGSWEAITAACLLLRGTAPLVGKPIVVERYSFSIIGPK